MNRLLILLALLLTPLVLAGLAPSAALAEDTMPPAPYAYRQLDDPKQETKAQRSANCRMPFVF